MGVNRNLDRHLMDLAAAELARAARKPSRRKRFKTTKLPDDPRIKAKRRGTHSLAARAPMRGDAIGGVEPGENERAIWLNVGRVIDKAPGKINGKDIA